MATVTYGTRRRLKKVLCITGIVLVILLILAILRFVYVGRYVVYDEKGVHLDFGTQLPTAPAQIDEETAVQFPLKSEAATNANITVPDGAAMPRLKGAYLPLTVLLENPDALTALEGNSFLAAVKTETGRFLYHTALGDTELSSLAQELSPKLEAAAKAAGITALAELPAFSDSAFALADFRRALPIEGGALWMDEKGSYRLDPANEEVLAYLTAQAEELARLGFEEIVFTDFDFPQSPYIVYEGDGVAAARDAAAALRKALDAKGIPVSFRSQDPEIRKLSARFFVQPSQSTLITEEIRQYADLLCGDNSRLVFLSDSRDTRMEGYSVLS